MFEKISIRVVNLNADFHAYKFNFEAQFSEMFNFKMVKNKWKRPIIARNAPRICTLKKNVEVLNIRALN